MDTMRIEADCPTCAGPMAIRIGHMIPHCAGCGWQTARCTCVIGPAVPAPAALSPVLEELPTSLGRLSDHEWEILRNTWMKGIDWVVGKLSPGRWEITPAAFKDWPLYRTKRAAYEAATNIILQEARNRAILRQREEASA